jgi:hypothetical protein
MPFYVRGRVCPPKWTDGRSKRPKSPKADRRWQPSERLGQPNLETVRHRPAAWVGAPGLFPEEPEMLGNGARMEGLQDVLAQVAQWSFLPLAVAFLLLAGLATGLLGTRWKRTTWLVGLFLLAVVFYIGFHRYGWRVDEGTAVLSDRDESRGQ